MISFNNIYQLLFATLVLSAAVIGIDTDVGIIDKR